MTVDKIIIGAGLYGLYAAQKCGAAGQRVLVLERRNHVGGNAYDCFDEAGVLIHQYGPHIFHTNDSRVFSWLSRFTQWRDYQHRVVADIPDGKGGRMSIFIAVSYDKVIKIKTRIKDFFII